MENLANSAEITTLAKRGPGAVSKYDPEVWEKIQNLVENHPEVLLSDIAKRFGMPLSTLESRASRAGWLNKRDLSKVRKADESLKKIIREVAFQINDLHSHSIAALEALQYSHRIKIVRDPDGKLHYVNFDDNPDRPKDFDKLSKKEQEAHKKYISPIRYKAFMDQLHFILQRQTSTTELVTKMTKAALPKIDPEIISLTSRVSEGDKLIDGTKIFKPKHKGKKDLEDKVNDLVSPDELLDTILEPVDTTEEDQREERVNE